MTRLEAGASVVGFLAVVLALAAVDWRLGLGVFGSGLLIASIDLPRPK